MILGKRGYVKSTVPAGADGTQMIVVVPTLNERESLPVLLPRILAAVPDVEVLIVDDASPDGTARWVEEEQTRNPQLHLLRRTGPRGLGRAYVDGFCWALKRGCRFVAQMDADGSHDPSSLPTLRDALAGADVAVGTRYMSGGALLNWPWYRRALSRSAGAYVRLLTGIHSADPTSGFRCFRSAALAALNPATLRSEGYAFQVELMHRAWCKGLRVVECPIVFCERTCGRSKLSSATIWEAVRTVPRLGRIRS